MIAGTRRARRDGVAGTADDVAARRASPAGCCASPRPPRTPPPDRWSRWPRARTPCAKDITDRIDAWDLRLAKRKETLTRQFTAMETALSSLQNQSTWLAGQISQLPSAGPDRPDPCTAFPTLQEIPR